MPARIPVKVGDQHFPSINQARLCYSSILRSYQPGQKISEQDHLRVLDLATSSNPLLDVDESSTTRVVNGQYRRRCFAISKQTISIMRSLKQCALQTHALKAQFECAGSCQQPISSSTGP